MFRVEKSANEDLSSAGGCRLPPAYTGSSLPDFSTLKMEAISSFETSVHTRSTQRHIPEDGMLHNFIEYAAFNFQR
jgi:hypothetical protein